MITVVEEPLLRMYAVRNKEGKYFRSKGYGGGGATWVESLSKARIYSRPGPARSQVTFFATHYPQFGIPEIVELHVTTVLALDETARVRKSIDRKSKEKAAARVRHAEWERSEAERKLAEAQRTLQRLGIRQEGRRI